MNITPQAGMPVIYHPHAGDAFAAGSTPLAAQIVYVWSETMVNLVIWDMYGEPHKVSSVHLNVPQNLGRWCEFPQWLKNAMHPPVTVSYGPDPMAGMLISSVFVAEAPTLCACGRSQALCEIVGPSKNKAA